MCERAERRVPALVTARAAHLAFSLLAFTLRVCREALLAFTLRVCREVLALVGRAQTPSHLFAAAGAFPARREVLALVTAYMQNGWLIHTPERKPVEQLTTDEVQVMLSTVPQVAEGSPVRLWRVAASGAGTQGPDHPVHGGASNLGVPLHLGCARESRRPATSLACPCSRRTLRRPPPAEATPRSSPPAAHACPPAPPRVAQVLAALARTSSLATSLATFEQYLHLSSWALEACALVRTRALPPKLNLVLQPLMVALRKEHETQLQVPSPRACMRPLTDCTAGYAQEASCLSVVRGWWW